MTRSSKPRKAPGSALSSITTRLGIHTPVGERGTRLSGGQREAIALARCLLRKPKLLLLDEPTANMDVNTEQQVMASLSHYLGEDPERTLVLATHKLHLLDLTPRIVVVDHGKISVDGARDAVMKKLRQVKAARKKIAPPIPEGRRNDWKSQTPNPPDRPMTSKPSPAKARTDPEWSEKRLHELAQPIPVDRGGQVDEEDVEFIQDCRAFLRREKGGLRGWLPWIAIAVVGLLIWWASWAELDEVTRGVGKVIPSSSVQLIQSLEGGILEHIYVKEGDRVGLGQPFASHPRRHLRRQLRGEPRPAR